ncbi:MAG TPA: hypothetical protein VGN17_22855 [Bryobacteraceae bacterium]|jgi:antitoxin (DNA-binding transcriptional repressor) of toxin-antitoxin stability system
MKGNSINSGVPLLHGAEIVIEHEGRPVARITPIRGPGRPIAECVAIAEARGSKVTLDEEFGRDLPEIIANRRPL